MIYKGKTNDSLLRQTLNLAVIFCGAKMLNEQTMWVAGGAFGIVVTLLSVIWTEIRSLRKDISIHGEKQAELIVRVSAVETIVEKLPCFRDFSCKRMT